MSDQACCAHIRVDYHTEDAGSGMVRGYWECASGCGTWFVPAERSEAVPQPPVWVAPPVSPEMVDRAIVAAKQAHLPQTFPFSDERLRWILRPALEAAAPGYSLEDVLLIAADVIDSMAAEERTLPFNKIEHKIFKERVLARLAARSGTPKEES